jgi:NAD(P)-dependent dehydrogenase (short-subunit alcohol dehydrogenase family)
MQRAGSAGEVVEPVAFLASDMGAYASGHVISINQMA